MATPSTSLSLLAAAASINRPNPGAFFNLALNQNAVRQSMLKHRRWFEEQKPTLLPGASESISDIESDLLLLQENASISNYLAELKRCYSKVTDVM